jgi:phosphatidylglycerol lysyltransferase
MVVMLRAFGVELNKFFLLRVGFVSEVLSNLIAIPASMALRLLALGHYGVTPSQTVGSSLLLAYFKNLVFFILIPISLVYIIFSYPLVFGGVAIMVLLIVILVIVIATAIFILYNTRIRVFVLKVLGNIWHFVTHKNIEKRLSEFGDTVTQGILQLKYKPKLLLLIAVLIVGEVAAMIAGLAFGFKALGIPVHLGVLITGFNFGITLTVISFIPGDLGVQEASIAGILAIFGVPFSQGVLGSMLFRVLYYFVPFIFSLGFYWSLLRETRKKLD